MGRSNIAVPSIYKEVHALEYLISFQGITTEDIPFAPKFVWDFIFKAVYNYKTIFVPEYFEQKYPRGLSLPELKRPQL